MVQYKSYPADLATRHNQYDGPQTTAFESTHEGRVFNSTKYWQLLDKSGYSKDELMADLRHRGVSTDEMRFTARNKDRLLQLASRSECGLLTYRWIPSTELRRFVSDRQLAPGRSIGRMGKFKMIALLEEADEEPIFHKFMDLAAELRVMIYTFHLQDLDTQSAKLPVTPPITRVSQQLRKESLPLFYSTCALSLNTTMFLSTIAPLPQAAQHHLASFQNFSASFNTIHHGFGLPPVISHITSLKLDMPRRRIRYTFTVAKTAHRNAPGYRTECQLADVLEPLMDEILALLTARKPTVISSSDGEEMVTSGLELQEGDFQAMRILFRDA